MRELMLPLFMDSKMAKAVTSQIEDVVKAKWSTVKN